MEQVVGEREAEEFTLVARKPYFDLPTACPVCLPLFIYLKLAHFPFRLSFNSIFPDSDQIPYVESGTYVAYNNENSGVVECLKKDGIVDLDSEFQSAPDWVSIQAMINSWLADALTYELWVGTDGKSAYKIYYSDLSWPIGKVLFLKQVYSVKQRLGITKDNAEHREDEIYRRAKLAYGALSTKLGEQNFLFDDRPSSLDATFLGHVLVTLHALPFLHLLNIQLSEKNLSHKEDEYWLNLAVDGSNTMQIHYLLKIFPLERKRNISSNHGRFQIRILKIPSMNETFPLNIFKTCSFAILHHQDTSVLRSKLLEHENIVRYAEKLKTELIESGSSSSGPQFRSVPSSSTPRKGPSNWSSKPKSKPKREKTEEEKTFKRRAKYFLAAQLLAVLLFLSMMGGYDSGDLELDDEDEGISFN
ncbi:mitochondrial outer membrane import complex protein METAXIN-like [Gossypium australe]|uniref:Mitochondrial outer membrane import complex protein METAXIN-like n=1 Tax=Gossypium australe TaxID=47621 RepID=A0A5B6VRA4_9ROSI|nr:mitochondrial outer membrane import complex protein METAXIN-like [Gossypium australe]